MTKKEIVLLDLNAKDKLHLFEQISKKAKELGIANDAQGLILDFYEKERNAETYLGTDCAIPHVRSSRVNESCIFFVRLAKPIKWSDEDTAQIIFPIFAKEEDYDLHIDMLLNISKKVMNKDNLKIFRTTKKVDDIVTLINK
ncbi:PTS sugar transporter subunit IIA [Oceanivirga salmonicida]|uniref:PTS sugar transporter subunit IIA n=1 Tax=Oceanivirga salmonicida TaxID=1769291 RepID=UPI00082B2C6F|nr:PTS sugar transporter subunit IIA [Oceanivirga salmonicida]